MSSKVINIVTAVQTSEYTLRLGFDDGVTQYVDFRPFLERALHPEIRAFLDLPRFASSRLEHGELVWDDYALCFPIMDLYTNHIDKHHLQEVTA